MTLQEQLAKAEQEHANAMQQLSVWGAKAQRSAGAIDALKEAIDSISTEPEPEPLPASL